MEPVRALFFSQWVITPVDWQTQACGHGWSRQSNPTEKHPKNTNETPKKHRRTALKHRQTALKYRHKPTKKLANVKKKLYLCNSKEQIITINKDGGTDEPNTQIMARTSKREMLARAEQNAKEMEKALKPKKAIRTKAIQPTVKAAQQHKQLYSLFREDKGTQYFITCEYHYTDELAIAWALRTLKRVKTIYKDMRRAVLNVECEYGGFHEIQGFYRA